MSTDDLTTTLIYRDRILAAAGVDSDDLTPKARRMVGWLAGWDESTIDGITALLAAAREAERARCGQ